MSEISEEDRERIRRECIELITKLVHYSDHLRAVESSELFAADGTWVRGGKPFTGREAIVKSFNGPATEYLRHFVTTPLIEVDDESHARGVSYYLLFRHDPGTDEPKLPMPLGAPFSMGEWHDRFVKTDQGWRFAHREVRRLFQAPT